ncbi:primosomal replication protein PriC [Paraferrimonas sedimenticola]|uniref:Restart primosome assembly protein PriC n=1 Tax=Paraferrimonas sedimenticola TaxID=375674 RepID=A0AA37RY83_9GAMM|nr:primosomal replication protein PriC [Paraferrimonas sedimenticola]GLP96932.1 hypothetical protein GCM10007895_22380 [Paraferrimonas sedimenticola]
MANAIARMRTQLNALANQARAHDQSLTQGARRIMANKNRFYQQLFEQHGGLLLPCVNSVAKEVDRLETMLAKKADAATIEALCLRIQDMFRALNLALNTTSVTVTQEQKSRQSAKQMWHKRQAEKLRVAEAKSAQEFSWIPIEVYQDPNRLEAEIAKHKQWLAKLELSLQKLEIRVHRCHGADKIRCQNELLTLDKRREQCRRALAHLQKRLSS